MELSVDITRKQIEQLMDDPGTELVIYYPLQAWVGLEEGVRVIVRISEQYLEENYTVQ